jgi:ATP phosphoribosyltransferase regulatory subunit
MRNWLLPEYIEDVLPAEAAQIESLRRSLLDLLAVHGYQFVIPPMMEYMESLITGVGHDLDLATFKVVDQLSGRLMGVRADITPQAARIDAHMLNNQGVTRLCYAGSVLRTSPDGIAQTRQPMQLGAELFGFAGVEGDIEIQRLMVQTLQATGVKGLQVDFSHVAVFNSIIDKTKIDASLEQALYQALQSKDKTTLKSLSVGLDVATRDALCALTDLSGDAKVLEEATKRLPKTAEINQALSDLKQVSQQLADLGVGVSFDLAELRGYHYHSGMVFAAYAQGCPRPLALGGRYDEVGQAFGRARPAVGFSLDLRGLVKALPLSALSKAILAPFDHDQALLEKVAALRAKGEKVIQALPGTEKHQQELNCDRKLVQQNGDWQVVAAPELVKA